MVQGQPEDVRAVAEPAAFQQLGLPVRRIQRVHAANSVNASAVSRKVDQPSIGNAPKDR